MNSSKTCEGGPAFPTDGEYRGYVSGMSLRDWFAGQALSGYLAAHADPEVYLPSAVKAATWAYQYADAMLAAREGEQAPKWEGGAQ